MGHDFRHLLSRIQRRLLPHVTIVHTHKTHRIPLHPFRPPPTPRIPPTPHLPPPSCPAPQVLETFPWDTTRVGVIIVEINEDVEKQEAIRSLLVGQHGFIQVDVLYGGVDDYYRHSSIKWDDSLRRKRKRRHPKGSHGC